MAWQTELTLIVRTLINDLEAVPTYSDARIRQMIMVAFQYVITDINLPLNYAVDIVGQNISPDPTMGESRNVDYLGLVALKSACMLDQSTLRTKLTTEGIRASLGPASMVLVGGARAFMSILEVGPCALYEDLVNNYNIGEGAVVRAVLGPFVGNNFYPYMNDRANDNRNGSIDFYSH